MNGGCRGRAPRGPARRAGPAAARALELERLEASDAAPLLPREAEDDRHVLLLPGRWARPAARPRPAATRSVSTIWSVGDAVERGLLLVDHEAVAAAGGPPRTSRRRPRPAVARRSRMIARASVELGRAVVAVDLGHQRLEHRRPRRDLRHLDPRPRRRARSAGARGLTPAARCRGSAPLRSSLRAQVHLEVGDVRAPGAWREVVADQPVEVVRRRGSDVDLEVRHIGDGRQDVAELRRHARGVLERGPLRHVDDHLELALVVERKHLHPDQLEDDQRAGGQQQEA